MKVHDWLPVLLLGFAFGALYVLSVIAVGVPNFYASDRVVTTESKQAECTPHFLGWGTSGYYVTSEKIADCVSCNAPMWSEAWCESCSALWLAVQ